MENPYDFSNLMNKYCKILIFIFSFIFLNLNIKPVNSSIISDEGPNDITVYKAFGFILFGNEGFLNKGIENITSDGCIITFETTYPMYSHAFKRIYVKYDLNKAIWKSTVYKMDQSKRPTELQIYGIKGLKELTYSHNFKTEDELNIAASMLSLPVGPQKFIKINLPDYATKERYDRAYSDLIKECPGIHSKY